MGNCGKYVFRFRTYLMAIKIQKNEIFPKFELRLLHLGASYFVNNIYQLMFCSVELFKLYKWNYLSASIDCDWIPMIHLPSEASKDLKIGHNFG